MKPILKLYFIFFNTGDVDSCDDNESERHSYLSNRNSNSSQRQSRAPPPMCPKSPPPTTLLATSTRNTSNNNYHHKHMVGGSVSATASPVNVLANYKDADRSNAQNRINNLNLLPQSESSRNTPPNYLKGVTNTTGQNYNNTNNLLRTATTNSSPIDHQISNLSLNSGVENNSTILAIHRQMRIRGYPNNNMVRHETKL